MNPVTNFKLPSGGTRRVALAAGTLAVVSLVAAACGGGGAKTSAGSSPSARSSSTAVASPNYVSAKATDPTTPTGPPAAFRPAASGMIASVSGNILEVQSPQAGQTTVNLSSKTVITATVSVGLSDVKTGGCISATGTKGSGGSIDAANVMLFSATKGTCVRGFGFGAGGGSGGAGGFPRTTRGTFPTRTSGTGGGRTFKRPANFATASGKVTSVSGAKIKVDAVSFSFSSKTKKPTVTTSSKMVSVSKSTKYSKSERVTSGSLKVGECVVATGSTNSIGAVAATTLIVTQPTSSGCSAFGGFAGFGGTGRGGGSTGGAA
jgi:hypothetical protein